MNYTIITDEHKLRHFIDWLPELKVNECFYLCLFARNKYVRDTPEYFPHIKSDKAQVKRLVVNRKSDLFNKIKQLEVESGAYMTKLDFPVPQASLALYISVNPRCQAKAARNLMKQLCDIITKDNEGFNCQAEALSAIQKSIGSKVYFDLDIDSKEDIHATKAEILQYLNSECLTFIETRGGIHALIEYAKIDTKYTKSWYKNIQTIKHADIQGDNMIPVIGCTQGGFTPQFI